MDFKWCKAPRYHRVWWVLRKFCDFGVKWSVFECILKQFIQFVSWLFQRCFAFLSSFQTSTTILFKVWFEVFFFLGGGFGRWVFESKSRRFHRDPPVESVKLMNIAVEVPLHRWMSPRWPTSSAAVKKTDRLIKKNITLLRRIRIKNPGKPQNPFFIGLFIVKNRKTLKNGQKTWFYGGQFDRFEWFRISEFKDTVCIGTWGNQYAPYLIKIGFFLFFSKPVKKINLRKVVKKISENWFFLQTDFGTVVPNFYKN